MTPERATELAEVAAALGIPVLGAPVPDLRILTPWEFADVMEMWRRLVTSTSDADPARR